MRRSLTKIFPSRGKFSSKHARSIQRCQSNAGACHKVNLRKEVIIKRAPVEVPAAELKYVCMKEDSVVKYPNHNYTNHFCGDYTTYVVYGSTVQTKKIDLKQAHTLCSLRLQLFHGCVVRAGGTRLQR